MGVKRKRETTQISAEEEESTKKRIIIEEQESSSDDDSDDDNNNQEQQQQQSSDEESEVEDEIDELQSKLLNEEEQDNDDDEEIRKLQLKKQKEMEKRLPGFKKKEKRLPAFEDEKTRVQFSDNVKRLLLQTKIPDREKWFFPNSRIPLLVLSKGKPSKLVKQHADMRDKAKETAQRKEEDLIILTRNHTIPTLATQAFEKELKEVATRGIVRLLNEVITAKKREMAVEDEVDDYAVLKVVGRNGRKNINNKNNKNNNKNKNYGNKKVKDAPVKKNKK